MQPNRRSLTMTYRYSSSKFSLGMANELHPIHGTTTLAAGTDNGGLVVADIEDEDALTDSGEISNPTLEIQVAITSHGELAAVEGAGWLRVIDLVTHEETKLLKDHDKSLTSMAYCEPLGLVAAGSHEGTRIAPFDLAMQRYS